MENCPPEILDRVFALACTDDGTTGRALSLVSTRIHDISSPHRYFSIHVSGVERLTKFATFLDKYHPPVQNLMLDCTVPGVEAHPISAYNYNEKAKKSSPHVSSIATVFRVLASQLRGLYLIPGPSPLYLDAFAFPLLETFYVYGDLYMTYIHWEADRFPHLTRLHVSCNSRTHLGHGTFLARLEIPTLTHLGCCAHRNSMAILVMLAALKATRQPPAWDNIINSIKRLSLFRVEIQPAPIGLLPELCEYTHTDELLEAVQKSHPAILGVPHGPVADGIVPMGEWQHVIEGRAGFMDVRPIHISFLTLVNAALSS